MTEPPLALGLAIEHGPEQVRNEHRWRVRLEDGNPAVLAQLLPELAADQAVRRRYVYEVERLARLDVACIARLLDMGPAPDPRDPAAPPPWRLRAAPPGQRLDAWLARSVRPMDEVLAMLAALAEAMHAVHRAGAVLRDLEPRNVLVDPTPAATIGPMAGQEPLQEPLQASGAPGNMFQIWLVDVGLARLDILSTRTASSLVLESSPYAAPEHLRATVVDPRSDIYTLGAIAWQALTGVLPHDDTPAFARASAPLPPLAHLRPDAPAGLDELLHACLAGDPDQRPGSAADVASALRGQPGQAGAALASPPPAVVPVPAVERIVCQACNARMRPGLRLCLSCGKTAVQLSHAAPDAKDSRALYLDRATEDAAFHHKLHELLETFVEGEAPHPDFLVGDARMYSPAERKARVPLPAPLFHDLPPDAARTLQARFAAAGLRVSVRPNRYRERRARRTGRLLETMGFGAAGIGFLSTVLGAGTGIGIAAMVTGVLLGAIGVVTRSGATKQEPAALARLRQASAALPASDPLVARVAGLLEVAQRPDVRERVGHLALLVQRLCDHQAVLAGARAGAGDDASAETLAMVTEPVVPLVDLAERAVRAIAACDDQLASLDEGELVRAIAACEARGEPQAQRAALLDALDRLRGLEDRRGAHMQRLLEASSLIERAVALGLDVEDARGQTERHVQMALAALESGT